jgi:hypothetical protein
VWVLPVGASFDFVKDPDPDSSLSFPALPAHRRRAFHRKALVFAFGVMMLVVAGVLIPAVWY